jgi:hypothetical protein
MKRLSTIILLGCIYVSYAFQLDEEFELDQYCSYASAETPTRIKSAVATNTAVNYVQMYKDALRASGLPKADISLYVTQARGVYSNFNKSNYKRSVHYNPAYFDSVLKVTGTDKAIKSIYLHELGHQKYGHPLRNVDAHLCEKQADRVSGFDMRLSHATLEEALIAMEHFGDESATPTHPKKTDRLIQIRLGYMSADITVFNSRRFIEEYSRLKAEEIVSLTKPREGNIFNLAGYDELGVISVEANSERPALGSYGLFGEVIHITENGQIVNDKNEYIGAATTKNTKSNIIKIGDQFYTLEDNKRIYTISENKKDMKMEVGYKIK